MGEPDEDLNYALYLTLDEMLLLCIEQLEAVRRAENNLMIGFHLRQASRALRSALLVYGDRIATKVPTEEAK